MEPTVKTNAVLLDLYVSHAKVPLIITSATKIKVIINKEVLYHGKDYL